MGEEEDPRQELVEQLLQYKMYKYMSYELRDRELDGGRTMYKDPTIPEEVMNYVEPVDLDELFRDLTLATLNRVFQDVIRRQEDKIDPVRSKFGKLEKEEVTVEEKLETVTDYAREHKHFSFRTLLGSQKSKMQTVVTFLAVLQLIKEGILIVQQEHAFDDIMITAKSLTKCSISWRTVWMVLTEVKVVPFKKSHQIYISWEMTPTYG